MSYRPRAFRSDLNFEIERRFREAGIDCPGPDEISGSPCLSFPRQRAPGGSRR